MSYITRDVGVLKLTSTSTAATAMPSNALGHLDDASSLTIFWQSSATALTSGTFIQVSQFDPADPFPVSGVAQSSGWSNISSSTPLVVASCGVTSITNVSFRGLRVLVAASGASAELNEPFAYVSKQITV